MANNADFLFSFKIYISTAIFVVSNYKIRGRKLSILSFSFHLQEGDEEVASRMQDLALAEGALPRHLHTAMFTVNTNDNRLLTNRQLSRHLIALWVTGHETAIQLLGRCLVSSLSN